MRRNLFDPEDFDRVSSGDSELAELMKQFDRERSEKEEEEGEEARADPEVGGRKRVRKEEGSYWLKWLQLYDITGNDEKVAIAFFEDGATFVSLIFSAWQTDDAPEGLHRAKRSASSDDSPCPSDRRVVLKPGSSTFVTSPGFPAAYPANARCSWSFEVSKPT